MVTSYPGKALPFGASRVGNGINFAVFSKLSTEVTLCLFRANETEPAEKITLDPKVNRTGHIWHILLEGLQDYVGYSYRLNALDPKHDFLDPFAKGVVPRRLSPGIYNPVGLILSDEMFDWEGDHLLRKPWSELVIYEMHVAGFTQDFSSGVKHPGTYLGLIEKIPYLVELGITAVELMPVFEFDIREAERSCVATKEVLGNYWGYSTTNFFSPATCFAASQEPGASIREFREMVKAFHKAGIEVILDVVYNHTAESTGTMLSFMGFDKEVYYLLDTQGQYLNYSGCGNTLRCNHPIVTELIRTSLRYWVDEMHVDGFRFDLASILTRDRRGNPQPYSPILEVIGDDPVLANVKLIAEPWDAVGLYQVGNFWPLGRRWSEWNGKYRDTLRRFIKGDRGIKGEFATRICGSEDLYGDQGSPRNSINFVTAHDGFTLADLVSYNQKHNESNGEGSRDGTNDNLSWNCGAEGPTLDSGINNRRCRQMRNFLVAMMVSRGVPMFYMGDEYGHSKQGDNNTWCRNDSSNWFQWGQLSNKEPLLRFFKNLIQLRKTYGVLRREAFYSRHDVQWHGQNPSQADWGQAEAIIAMTLHDHTSGDYLYVAFNASDKEREFILPELAYGLEWAWVANTAEESPKDFPDDASAPVKASSLVLCDRSAIILKGIPLTTPSN